MHVEVLPMCMSVYHIYAQCPQQPEEGDVFPLDLELLMAISHHGNRIWVFYRYTKLMSHILL